MDKHDKNNMTEKEFLESYSNEEYPCPSVTADILIFSISGELPEILMIKRKNHPFIDTWALPGGFANPDESVDETAMRELKEETGVEGLYLEQLGLFSKPNRDPRAWVMTCAYIAVAKKEELSLKAADDAADAKWFKAEYEIKDEQFILKLSSDEGVLSAVLDMHVRKTPFGITTRFEIVDSGGIAFDHAEIIAKGLLRLAGRPYSHFNKNQK